jgi:8-oxo-dGTP pyrophosphatase MutT (NUDIX family)
MSAQPSADGLRIRQAARAVVRAPDHRVLLVRFEFPAGTRWALPGGGLDVGETHEAALRRELNEELGLRDATIGPHIWNRLHIIPFINGAFDGQREQIHLVEVDDAFEPRPMLSWEQLNSEFVFELRWWHLDEIEAASDQSFVPTSLGALLRSLVDDGPPDAPIDVPV